MSIRAYIQLLLGDIFAVQGIVRRLLREVDETKVSADLIASVYDVQKRVIRLHEETREVFEQELDEQRYMTYYSLPGDKAEKKRGEIGKRRGDKEDRPKSEGERE